MTRFAMPETATTETVWSRLSSDLRRFIRRRVRDDQTADDLLQEVFLRIHRRIDSLADESRLASWVYRIARNAITDHYRAANRDAESLAADPVAEAADREAIPECADVWLDELIRQLPDGYAVAIRLAEIEGLTQQEVADRLGLSLSGAKSRIQRGRELLRQELDRCCRFEFDRRGNLIDVDPRPERRVCRDCGEQG
jgi:RNA polymerase sigma-70 factor (ECF subfamily)